MLLLFVFLSIVCVMLLPWIVPAGLDIIESIGVAFAEAVNNFIEKWKSFIKAIFNKGES